MKHLRTLSYIADVVRSGSVRRTAERLNITPSALTRQIQDFEQELGTPIFERRAQGMRLNPAGELVIRYIRDQTSDLEEMRSRIADLQGVRRGHVAIASSQAFVDHVVPDEINTYRRQHGQVSFDVVVRDHAQAVKALLDYEVDLALILQPPPASELRILFAYQLPLCAMMSAGQCGAVAEAGPVRLRECLTYPIAMPDHSLAVRHLLDAALVRASLSAEIVVGSASLEFLRRLHVQNAQQADLRSRSSAASRRARRNRPGTPARRISRSCPDARRARTPTRASPVGGGREIR